MLRALSEKSPFCCGAVVHPAMIASEDGDDLALPLGFYPSADEPKDVADKISAAIKAKDFKDKCEVHLYDTV